MAARLGRRFALGMAVTAAFVLVGPSMASTLSGWSAPVPVDPSFFSYSVSCPSSSFCAGVGSNGKALTYNGSSWSTPASIDVTNSYFSSVSCSSSSFCAAVASNGTAVTYDGSSWSAPAPIANVASSVSCPSASFCAAVGSNGTALTYNGSSWSAPARIDGANVLTSVSCPSASFCAAVDNKGNALTYNGSSWSAPANIDGTNTLVAVSCPSASFCAAVDNKGNALTYNGSAWSAPASIDAFPLLSSVSCPSASFCAAVDLEGHALTYNGSSWSAPANVDGQYHNLDSVSCSSVSFCAAVDGNGRALTYDGSSWGPAVALGGGTLKLSCPSASFCAAVDGNGQALTYNGSSWSAPAPIDGTAYLSSVSCPSASFCAAVDLEGNALTYNGSSWSASANIDGTNPLVAVSCPSASFCAAVDNNGNALTYNGSSWSAPANIDSTPYPNSLYSVSCPSSSFCAAVGGNGTALTYNGSSWSAPANVDGTNPLVAVSCPSASFCAAVDNNGNALTYNGSSWSAPATVDGTILLTSVSCPSASFCAVVDYYGSSLTYSGSFWSAPIRIVSAFASVSCPSASFCAAVDYSGDALTYSTPPPANVSPPTVSGSAVQGQTLSEASGKWADTPTSFSYQWMEDCNGAGSNCTPIRGATGQTYTLTSNDVGHTIRVQESAANAAGTSAPVTSNPTAIVQARPVAPVNLFVPALSGTPAVGQTLNCSPGSWSASPTPTFSYQWQSDGAPIAGATNSTHVVQAADQNRTLSCEVTATNSAGHTSAASAGLTILASPRFGNTANLEPVSGTTFIKLPGSNTFTRLNAPVQIPVGATIDATHGRVRIISAKSKSRSIESAEFYSGEFKLLQPTHGKPMTELDLTGFDPSACNSAPRRRGHLARAHHRSSVSLWGSGHGNYQTKGRHGSATVRGTVWLTRDGCAGTFFKAQRDTVIVHDFTLNRTVILHTGQHYLARP